MGWAKKAGQRGRRRGSGRGGQGRRRAGVVGVGLGATANAGGGGATSRAAAVRASEGSGPRGDGTQVLSRRHGCKNFGRLDFLANGVKSASSQHNSLEIRHISRLTPVKNS